MSFEIKNGDLLSSECDYICHQVNCMGKMNSGIAKQIREKWPIVFQNYMAKCNFNHSSGYIRPEELLGDIQFVPLYEDYHKDIKRQQVINMFSQYGYGYDGLRYTSYDAFWTCLKAIKKNIPKGVKIGFPYHIGCDRGGANWRIIETMIREVLEDEYIVEIWKLEEINEK